MYPPIETNFAWLLRHVLYKLILLLVISLCVFALLSCASPAESVPSVEKDPVRLTMAVTDISVGKNRIAFGIIQPKEGPIRGNRVELETYYLDGPSKEITQEVLQVIFREWPTSQGGVYTTEANFPHPGRWGLVATIREENQILKASGYIEVANEFSAPSIGSKSPVSKTKTLTPNTNIENITSDSNPYPPIYSMSIAEAINSGKPSVIVFATPAFCRTSTCGPQVEVIKELHKKIGTSVNFIHVEIFDNLNEINGDINKAIVSEEVRKWNLPTEPWTFLVDSKGIITHRFEGFTTTEELEESLTIAGH